MSAATAAGTPLPCLYSHNCTEIREKPARNTLQGGHKKTAELLRRSIEKLAAEYGIERVGFLTLTFAEHITDLKEAQKRWHSLRTHILKKRYVEFVKGIERQESGRVHYHVVIVLKADIRTGVNFEEFKARRYTSANPALRAEWAFWRKTAPKYRFGRTELMPIKSSAEAIAKYVGKYISKHISQRIEADKGFRLVEYTRGARAGTTQFAWNSPRSRLWRAKVAVWAAKHGLTSYEQIAAVFGPKWAYHHCEAIMATVLDSYPDAASAQADGRDLPEEILTNSVGRITIITEVDGVNLAPVKVEIFRHASWDEPAPEPRKYELRKVVTSWRYAWKQERELPLISAHSPAFENDKGFERVAKPTNQACSPRTRRRHL